MKMKKIFQAKLFPLNATTKTRPNKLLQSTKLRAYLLKLKPTIDQQIYLVTSPKFLFRVVQINLQTLIELLMRDILETNLSNRCPIPYLLNSDVTFSKNSLLSCTSSYSFLSDSTKIIRDVTCIAAWKCALRILARRPPRLSSVSLHLNHHIRENVTDYKQFNSKTVTTNKDLEVLERNRTKKNEKTSLK